VGANLAKALLKFQSDMNVALLVRQESNIWRIEDILSQCILFESDLSDKLQLSQIIRNFEPDVIFHLASYGAYPRTQDDINLMIKTNILGSMNLIQTAGSIPVICAGSSSEYGIKKTEMSEGTSCRPDNAYGWSKLAQTTYVQLKGAVTLRLFHVYGPWEEPTRLIPQLIKAKLQNLPLRLTDSVRDYVFVDDVVTAFMAAAEKFHSIQGQTINIGSGSQTEMRHLLEIFDTIDHSELILKWDFKPVQTEPDVWHADISKAKKVLEWTPHFTISAGLKETYKWWKEYLT